MKQDQLPAVPRVLSLLEDLPRRLETERFETLLEGSDWRLERILSTGHSTPEDHWYEQERNEWVLVLTGCGRLVFEDGSERLLGPGDAVLIQAGCRHRVSWTSPEETTVWLALHFETAACRKVSRPRSP